MLNEQELQKLEDLKALKEKEGNAFHPTYQEELDSLLAKQAENSEEAVPEGEPATAEEVGAVPEGTDQEPQEETVTGEGSTEIGETEGGESDGQEEKSGEEISQEGKENQEG